MREEYEEAHKVAKAMKELVDTTGWKLLMQVASAQIEVRNIASSNPMGGIEDVFSKQLVSGEILGIKLVSATPESMLEEAQSTIEQLKGQITDE